MIWFCFGKENTSSRRVILKIELELNNLNSILSRSAVTPVFPDDQRTATHRNTQRSEARCTRIGRNSKGIQVHLHINFESLLSGYLHHSLQTLKSFSTPTRVLSYFTRHT